MTAETVITVLATTLLGTGWGLWLLPVATCKQCPHCQMEQLARQREHEAEAGRIYGIPRCPACGRHHPRGESHRP